MSVRINTILLRATVFTVLIAGTASVAEAQRERADFPNAPAASFPSARIIATASVGGQFPVILVMHRVGVPTRLADGRVETHFTVQANVPFVLRTADNGSEDVRVLNGAAETPLAEFVGAAGFHADILVRAPDDAPLDLSLESRAATPRAARLPGAPSGR